MTSWRRRLPSIAAQAEWANDGVADFDAVVRHPANPRHIKAEFDSGDHLHPNGAGHVAVANSIDLAAPHGNRR